MTNFAKIATRLCLLLATGWTTGCRRPQPDPSESATTTPRPSTLDRGIHYLLQQQSDDNLWHSPNYGNLRDGAAMTAFVLYALQSHAFDDKRRLQAAVDRLAPAIRKHGYVTNADGPDYTNYGSAMLLLACEQLQLKIPGDVKTRLLDYLVRSQLDDDEGYDESRVDYGGWDLSGWMTGKRPTTGSTISVSATTLQALHRHPDHSGVSQALAAAGTWILRLHNRQGDGGFFFHPQKDHDGNKAGWSDGNTRQGTRSYGSATADGLRILSYLNDPKYDKPMASARNWIHENPGLKLVPGFDHETGASSWAHGLRYYYYQSLSQSLGLLAEEDARRIAEAITGILVDEQYDDGHWSNPNARMREDDPFIATGFAIIALRNCQTWQNANRRP